MTRSTLFTLAAAGLVSTAACAGSDTKAASDSSAASSAPSASTSARVDLTGAGATFPYPIYSKWISDYSAKTGVKINYQAIGSGGGIRQLQEGTVDFGASDAPMTDEEAPQAYAAARKALALKNKANGKERALIDAMAVRYLKTFDATKRVDQDRTHVSPLPTCQRLAFHFSHDSF